MHSWGRNESKHLRCEYKDRREQCSDICTRCTFAMKSDGDAAVAEGDTELAIRQYKRALFAEPRFADAWVSLGNAYGMRAEYNNALDAFDRAIAIDPTYGDALFGKAIVLRSIGHTDAAMLLANTILSLYDHANVRKLKEKLIEDGAVDGGITYTLDHAIDKMTALAYTVLQENGLCGADGRVVTERVICRKETFTHRTILFCKKQYGSLGSEKVRSESILTAFYASVCATLFYYQDKSGFANTDPFDYLIDHMDLEQAGTTAERLLGIQHDETACTALWDMIYGYVRSVLEIAESVQPAAEIDHAIQDAAESAYMIGMMYAIRAHEQQEENRV